MFYDVATGAFVFGLEDAKRISNPTNNDFNDGMVYIKPFVASTISTANAPALPRVNDSDGDGVPNGQDYFPNDPTRAYSVGSPLYSVAFEDNFPNKGDYDMNDLVTTIPMTKRTDTNAPLDDGWTMGGRWMTYKSGFCRNFNLSSTCKSL